MKEHGRGHGRIAELVSRTPKLIKDGRCHPHHVHKWEWVSNLKTVFFNKTVSQYCYVYTQYKNKKIRGIMDSVGCGCFFIKIFHAVLLRSTGNTGRVIQSQIQIMNNYIKRRPMTKQYSNNDWKMRKPHQPKNYTLITQAHRWCKGLLSCELHVIWIIWLML